LDEAYGANIETNFLIAKIKTNRQSGKAQAGCGA
jgi:hypothetical protein